MNIKIDRKDSFFLSDEQIEANKITLLQEYGLGEEEMVAYRIVRDLRPFTNNGIINDQLSMFLIKSFNNKILSRKIFGLVLRDLVCLFGGGNQRER